MQLPGSRTMSCIAMRRTCIVRQSSQRHVSVITYSVCNITKHHRVQTCKQHTLPPMQSGHLSALSRPIDWTVRRGMDKLRSRFILHTTLFARIEEIKRKNSKIRTKNSTAKAAGNTSTAITNTFSSMDFNCYCIIYHKYNNKNIKK